MTDSTTISLLLPEIILIGGGHACSVCSVRFRPSAGGQHMGGSGRDRAVQRQRCAAKTAGLRYVFGTRRSAAIGKRSAGRRFVRPHRALGDFGRGRIAADVLTVARNRCEQRQEEAARSC